MTVHVASGALLITLTWLVLHGQAHMLPHSFRDYEKYDMGINPLNSFPDSGNDEKRDSLHNSDAQDQDPNSHRHSFPNDETSDMKVNLHNSRGHSFPNDETNDMKVNLHNSRGHSFPNDETTDMKVDLHNSRAHSFPVNGTYEKRANTRNSDPKHDLAAITALSPSILQNLPFGVPLAMTVDIPGPPLTPEEFNFKIPETVQDYSPASDKNDPIELAGAFEGDIILSTPAELQQLTQPGGYETMAANTRNAVIELDRVWPNAEIPYAISSTFGNAERGTIAVAMRSFHENTCIKFVPRTTQKDYIHIYKGDGCSSSVGRVGGAQAVSLGEGCLYAGIVMHELMHAAGFWHEQSRYDRDQFIRIVWTNIKSGMDYNFRKYDWNTISHLNKPYDLGSIMHYGEKSFAKNPRKNTIESLDGTPIGQRSGFSKLDLEKLNKLYKCGETNIIKVTTVSPGTSGGNQKKCVDFHKNCPSWSKMGECERNPDYMLASCKKSCNTCDEICKNLDKSCAYWANLNECTSNTAYMHLYCKDSCGLCHNANDFTNDCIDQNQYCAAWAAEGTCHTNPDYMVTFCKMSCTSCEPM